MQDLFAKIHKFLSKEERELFVVSFNIKSTSDREGLIKGKGGSDSLFQALFERTIISHNGGGENLIEKIRDKPELSHIVQLIQDYLDSNQCWKSKDYSKKKKDEEREDSKRDNDINERIHHIELQVKEILDQLKAQLEEKEKRKRAKTEKESKN